jgi:S1-C subfamily serine protease
MTIATESVAKAEPTATLDPKLYELNTVLMNTTFMISGPSTKETGKTSAGTGFIVGKPAKDKDFSYFVLVTAAHVFEDISGDIAYINPREKQADESFKEGSYPIAIRRESQNLYVKHKELDVAALFVNLPDYYKKDIVIGDALLATEDSLAKFEVHPGDELLCLGYPLGLKGPFGFPILRSGKIASYPLLPASINKVWAFDFSVFSGNSGGPVYLVDRSRVYGGEMHFGETVQFVLGLVTQKLAVGHQELQLGVVIPAPFILETINLLPEAPK